MWSILSASGWFAFDWNATCFYCENFTEIRFICLAVNLRTTQIASFTLFTILQIFTFTCNELSMIESTFYTLLIIPIETLNVLKFIWNVYSTVTSLLLSNSADMVATPLFVHVYYKGNRRQAPTKQIKWWSCQCFTTSSICVQRNQFKCHSPKTNIYHHTIPCRFQNLTTVDEIGTSFIFNHIV